MIYKTIYKKILKLLPEIEAQEPSWSTKLVAAGYMDLHVDVLSKTDSEIVIALAHRYIQNGDSMADPDMEIRIIPGMKMTEALSFQQDGSFQVYQRVYSNDGKFVNPTLKTELNSFLNKWLSNINQQGHKLPDLLAA